MQIKTINELINNDRCLVLYLELTEYIINEEKANKKAIEKIINDNSAIENVVKEMKLRADTLLLKTVSEFFEIFPFTPKLLDPIRDLYIYDQGSESFNSYIEN